MFPLNCKICRIWLPDGLDENSEVADTDCVFLGPLDTDCVFFGPLDPDCVF